MQLIANLTGKDVLRMPSPDMSAVGVALMAGIQLGRDLLHSIKEFKQLCHARRNVLISSSMLFIRSLLKLTICSFHSKIVRLLYILHITLRMYISGVWNKRDNIAPLLFPPKKVFKPTTLTQDRQRVLYKFERWKKACRHFVQFHEND